MRQRASLGPTRGLRRPPPNLAAQALAEPLYRQRIVKSKKTYSRKDKFKCCKNATLD
jgi:stalled ribosome alternative rescue factor ArfA